MKIEFVTAAILIFLVPLLVEGQETATGGASPVSQSMDTSTGQVIEFSNLIEQLGKNDVVFLGEQHDNDSGHQFQLQVIQDLHKKGLDVVISMEQFERDVQGAVDDYLADRIAEKDFLASSRPWKNYDTHYRPIIEFAKENQFPVLAANVPTTLARRVAKGESVPTGLRMFAPRKTTAPEDAYWENFVATMKDHMGAEGTEKLKGFYASQCIKDDSMAETIADYLAKNQHRPKVVVHLCGHFHSDYGLGTVGRFIQRKPLARFAVVTMESIPTSGKLEVSGIRDRAHYVFWTVENPKAKADLPVDE